MVMPNGASLDAIMGAIMPLKGDQLRRNNPRGDIENFKDLGAMSSIATVRTAVPE